MRFMKLGRLTVIASLALGCLVGEVSTASAQRGEITIRTAPPAPRYESRGSPRAGYEWVPGYWRWEGRRHIWVAGHWERARAGYVWQPARWDRRHDGWVFIPGHWVLAARRPPPPPYTRPPGQQPHDRPPQARPGYGRAHWERQGWRFIGEAWVSGHEDRDVIQIGPRRGQFSRLLLVAEDGDVEMHDIRLEYGNGRHWSPNVRQYFREDQRSRPLDLPNAPRSLNWIEFRYSDLPGGGRARIQVWGR
jgi:hypothetical protein